MTAIAGVSLIAREAICLELDNKKNLQAHASAIEGLILRECGRSPGSPRRLFRKQEALCRQLQMQQEIAASLIAQALLMESLDRMDQAVNLASEAHRIAIQAGHTSMAEQIAVYMQTLSPSE